MTSRRIAQSIAAERSANLFVRLGSSPIYGMLAVVVFGLGVARGMGLVGSLEAMLIAALLVMFFVPRAVRAMELGDLRAIEPADEDAPRVY